MAGRARREGRARSPAAQALFSRLSCGLGRRDEAPDVAVGQEIAERRDPLAVAALVELLASPDSDSSAIKALYECGYLAPDLLAPHAAVFLDLLESRKNRLVWGAMIALWCVAKAGPGAVWPRRDEVMRAFEAGTVITRGGAIKTLATVAASRDSWRRGLTPWLLGALEQARGTDVPGWLEELLPALSRGARRKAAEIVKARLAEMSPSSRKRAERLLDRCR